MTDFNKIVKYLKKSSMLIKQLISFIRVDFFFNVYIAKTFNNFFEKLNFFLFFNLKHTLIDQINIGWVKKFKKVHFFTSVSSLPWFKIIAFTISSLIVFLFVVIALI